MVVGVTVQLKHTELLVNHCKKQVFFFSLLIQETVMLVSVVNLLGTEYHTDDDAEIGLCDTSDKKMRTSVAIKVALESLYKNYFGIIITNISCEFGRDLLAMQTTGLKLLE